MILGADFSSYQPSVDWPTYKKYGRDFALIKATEGTSYVNPLFTSQIDGAEAAGVAVGVYHFYAWGDPNEEASRFYEGVRYVTTLKGVPAAVDFETGSYTVPPDANERFSTMLRYVEALFGYPPLWYSSSGFLSQYNIVPPSRNGPWVASWGSSPPTGFFALWQHAASQSIPGVPTPVDSDVFNGTVEQFRLYGGR